MIARATNKRMGTGIRSAAHRPAAFCRMIPDFRVHGFRLPRARFPRSRTHGFRPFRANTFHPFGRQMQNDNIQTVRTATAK